MNYSRAASVAKKLDMHRVSVYKLMARVESFPRPIKRSSRYVVWIEQEVDEWMLTGTQLYREKELLNEARRDS